MFFCAMLCTNKHSNSIMSQSTTMTIRLEPELKSRLDKLANATHRSKSFLASQAVREYIELNEWQILELKEAIKEADAEDFASDQEVVSVFNKWATNAD